jgi:hypothetical protein
MSVLGIGADFGGFQRLLADRTAEVEQRFIAPLDAAAEHVRELEQQLEQARTRTQAEQAQSWADYKPGYEALLPGGEGEGT